MEKCLVDLYSATTQVDRRYFRTIGTRPNQTQYPQHIEQSFSAELYHRYRNIMELPSNINYYEDLILHFDITKLSVDSRPDLVLHRAQENRDNQKMYIEVKTDPGASLTSDFNKLITATDSYLNFSNAILIIVNRTFASVLESIYSHDQFYNLEQGRKRKIYIISVTEIPNDEIEYNLYSIKFLPNERR